MQGDTVTLLTSVLSACSVTTLVLTGCFCLCWEQTPFTLTLRLWDIYILEGERVLTAMAYTILKLHKSKCFVWWAGSERSTSCHVAANQGIRCTG